jgi:hypothetical protein
MKKTILLLAILQGIFTRVLSQEPPQSSGIDKADAASWAFNDAKSHHNGALAKLLAPTLYGRVSGEKPYDASIERVVIDAKASGDFAINVFSNNTKPDQFIEVQVQDLTGKIVGAPIQVAATDKAEIKKEFSLVKTWNPENPHLYQAVINIKDASQQVLNTFTQKFGFRTVEGKGAEGIFINGTKVIFKGINKREGGSADANLQYINTLKDLNMNAVRVPENALDPSFLDMCDSLGLFVISELANAGKTPEAVKKHIKEIVSRDVNHPSIIMWSLNGESADAECKSADLQQRLIIHPTTRDAETKKGADFKDVANTILYGTDAFYPAEISNGIYVGGRAAGLEDFWNEMTNKSKFSGAFLSSYKDDKPAADGDDKGANYYTIKEIFAPVSFDPSNINVNFNGNLNVENHYLYTNLNKCRFDWKLVLFPKATERRTTYGIVAEGTGVSPYTGPGEKGVVKLALPAGMTTISDALLVSVYDAKGNEIYTQNYPIHKPVDVLKTAPEVASISTIMRTEDDNFLSLVTDGINYIFDKKNGNLTKVYCGKRDIPFIGPFLAGAETTMADFKHLEKDNVHLVEITYKGENTLFVRWTFKTGDLPKMEYQYTIGKGSADYTGITFKYPEEKIVGMKWMGRGPWQVWKNRMKGQQIGIWEKSNRASATGEPAKNAEYKGWHSEIYWIQFQTNMGNFTIYTDQSDLYLQLFNPLQAGMASNDFTNPPFPENGNIGFMHSIGGLGKYQSPEISTASKSLKSVKSNEPLSGTLWIDFRW